MKDTVIPQFEFVKWAVHQNLEGLSHEDSLVTPDAGGNSTNWVVGHLVNAYDNLLKALGEDPICDPEQMTPYKRGCDPMDPASARQLDDLMADFDRGHDRVVAKVATLSNDDLSTPTPVSPTNNPNETIGSLIGVFAFHQAYHAGQSGVLRRVTGRPGAIA